MQLKQLTSLALTLALGVTQVTALEHGDVEEYNGGTIKWLQVGKGMWSGIPIEEWDDDVHKRSDVDFHLDEARSGAVDSRSLELETRDWEGFCESAAQCATTPYAEIRLVECVSAFVQAADAAAGAATTIWDFLNNNPFIATVSGAYVAGVLVDKSTTPASNPSECSSNNVDVDALVSALNIALSSKPSASSISTDVLGPTSYYTVTVTATPESRGPTTPVSGKCFTG